MEDIPRVEIKREDSDDKSEQEDEFDEDSATGVESEEKESEDIQVGPRRSSRTARAPNILIPTMTNKRHGNS